MPFEIKLNGRAYTTDQLTLEEAEALELECGKTWLELNPIRSAKEFKATARVFLTREKGADEAARIVSTLTLRAALDAVRWVDEDIPDVFVDGIPKVEATTSTPTS